MSAIILDGLDSAIVGFTTETEPRAVYDSDKILAILMDRDGMTEEQAIDYYEYNIEGGYLGEGSPLFIRVMTLEEFEEML
jgi:hypothetical protein